LVANRIFCVHGGLPRAIVRGADDASSPVDLFQQIENLPKGYINTDTSEAAGDKNDSSDDVGSDDAGPVPVSAEAAELVLDLLWADPTRNESRRTASAGAVGATSKRSLAAKYPPGFQRNVGRGEDYSIVALLTVSLTAHIGRVARMR
jgi:hypothetical protein